MTFLLLRIEFRIILLLMSIFILSFFYNYFPILPDGVKVISEIYILIFFLEIFIKKKF